MQIVTKNQFINNLAKAKSVLVFSRYYQYNKKNNPGPYDIKERLSVYDVNNISNIDYRTPIKANSYQMQFLCNDGEISTLTFNQKHEKVNYYMYNNFAIRFEYYEESYNILIYHLK